MFCGEPSQPLAPGSARDAGERRSRSVDHVKTHPLLWLVDASWEVRAPSDTRGECLPETWTGSTEAEGEERLRG